RLAAGRYPYGVAVRGDGVVYVSAWGESGVSVFEPGATVANAPARTTDPMAPRARTRMSSPPPLVAGPRIVIGRHPSAVVLDASGDRLYVACAASDLISIVDPRRGAVIARLEDSAPGGPREGSTPNGLALSPDGRRLYVAEADNDAVAVFGLGGVPPAG